MLPSNAKQQPKLIARAVAALKAKVTGGDSRSEVNLSFADSHILRDLGNELLVAYLVDQGNHFEWIQQRHLEQEGFDSDQLHAIGVENLRKLAQTIRVTPYGNIFAVLLDGNFEPAWSCWINCGRNRFGSSCPANMRLPFPYRTSSRSAMRHRKLDCRNCGPS